MIAPIGERLRFDTDGCGGLTATGRARPKVFGLSVVQLAADRKKVANVVQRSPDEMRTEVCQIVSECGPISAARIAGQMQCGRGSVYATLNRLRKCGRVKMSAVYNPNGQPTGLWTTA